MPHSAGAKIHSPVTTIARIDDPRPPALLRAELRRALNLSDPGARLGQIRPKEVLPIAERHARFAKWGAAIGFALNPTIDHDRVGIRTLHQHLLFHQRRAGT